MSAALAVAGCPELRLELAAVGSMLLQLMLAGLFGAVVAILYRLSRPAEEHTHRFWHTLVLLAPLITMVTMAVGNNSAAAFTLVGTLAIVRFRTVVRDTRDTVFVIFSVAIGMSVGLDAKEVAVAGTVVLAAAIFALRALSARKGVEPGTGHLRLTLHPADCPDRVWRPVVEQFASSCRVQRSTVDRKDEQLRLRLAIIGIEPAQGIELVQRLTTLPEVAEATFIANDEPMEPGGP